MKRSLRYRMRRFWNELPSWAQVALVLGVVVLISFMFPTNVKFDYTYERGQRWRYDDLVAPFDFAVRKGDEEIRRDRQRILDARDPYLVYRPADVDRALASYEAQFQAQLQQLRDSAAFADVKRRPERYWDAGRGLLDRALRRGVVDDAAGFASAPRGVVNVVRGATIEERGATQLLDVEETRRRLRDSVQRLRLRDRDFLLPLVTRAVEPSVVYSDSLTDRFVQSRLDEMVLSRGMVRQGELIVVEDGIVTDEIARTLDSYKAEYEAAVVDSTQGWLMFLGYLVLTSIIMAVLLLYFRMFHPQEFVRFNRLIFILLLVLLTSFAVFRIDSINALSVYLMPFAIVPIVIKNFYPPGVALFTHLVIVLIASFLSSLGYEFTFLQIVAGIVAVLSPTGVRDWSKILRTMVVLAATYLFGYLGLEMIEEGNWRAIDWTVLTWLGLNVFLTLLAYPLVPLFGRLFGFMSDVVLLEWSDVNRPLLRDLAVAAPGTLQHSLAVSNLAEAAAREIGADTLLVKVAALYHDIGKSVNPKYFIENQTGVNPHEGLSELESARVIIGHVTEGLKLGRKNSLPSELLTFIACHHGTTRVEYFWRTYAAGREEDVAELDDGAFRYPGPLPTSREQSILMLADSLEAAARAQRDPTAEDLDQLVDGIVAGKLTGGQLAESELSFRELKSCVALFKRMLKSMYHARVEYPDAVDEPGTGPTAAPLAPALGTTARPEGSGPATNA